MTVDVSPGSVAGAARGASRARSDAASLRALAIAAGVGWSLLFVLTGVWYQLQLYGDGSIFSYAVAVQDAWAFHWHNISGRLFVYLVSDLPAEAYVALTGDAHGGIAVYGFLFFIAPLLGLFATFAADRSEGRIFFFAACLSTACLCPLVFGFPTEMWMAHSLFWPTLAVCHAKRGMRGEVLFFALLLALFFTHGGGRIFAAAIVFTLLLPGMREAAFLRAACALLVVAAIWSVVRVAIPSDDYVASVLWRAALHVFDPSILTRDLVLLLAGVLAGYGIVFLLLRRLTPAKAHVYAGAIVAVALAVYWLRFDQSLHTNDRYCLRTLLIVVTPIFGAFAAAFALRAEGRLKLLVPLLPRGMAILSSEVTARAAVGAVILVMLVHAVETAKFVTAWTAYKQAVRALAMGSASDPALGDRHFVSSDRIAPDLNRLSWSSTTHFLSVLVAPGMAPTRLVVDPSAGYFWLPCETATASLQDDSVVPLESRRLIRVHACLHR